uniref:Zf-CCHC domain-containing protein/UBN2 domain-containing protein n=1 Tax=Tanacetum cinerariifolium TaxID=118510 RepID=A0A6L2KJK4_TANCI|nr:zf-CCHC domain-containing protein/UBN2 domain-containing protein [Tanacetum cinerariifolium]
MAASPPSLPRRDTNHLILSLKIINKNNTLKTKRDLLEKEVLELNEKIKKLKRSKEIDIACKSCQELKLENARLKETQVKFVKFDKSANSIREMLNNQKSSSCKIGLGFDSSKASKSGTKLMSFVGSFAEIATGGSTIKVHKSTLLGSVSFTDGEKVTEHVFSPPMSSRSDFVITRKKSIHNRIDESQKPSLKPSLKSGIEESLNVTFDESPPPTKLSPLVDDVGEEEATRKNTKVVNNKSEEDESIKVDKIVNIKESKNHPLDQFIGNLNQRTLRIQIYIKKEWMFRFKPLFKEGQCYSISNFAIAENSGKLPLLPHKYKISFYKGTVVTRIDPFDENLNGFILEPFNRLLDGNRHYHEHEAVGISNQLDCTFSDHWANMWDEYTQKRNELGHVVFILQLGKVKYWDGTPSIHNALFGTKMFINRDLPEIQAFRQQFKELPEYDENQFKISLHIHKQNIQVSKRHAIAKLRPCKDARFETYVKAKDLDLWHIILNGNFPPLAKNEVTQNLEVVPFEEQSNDLKKKLAKNNEAKMVLYNALPKKEFERIFMCKTAKDIWRSLLITHQEESIDSGFARFNTIITSLKALDEGFSSKNYVRKFLRALHLKWRVKVTAIEKLKDLSSLALDELIGNLKVHEVVMEKVFESYKGKKERVKSITLKAKKKSSDDETSTSRSDDEEYVMAVRNFKKFFRRKGKFVRQPREENKSFRQRDENKGKSDRKCFRCGDPNHLIRDCPKPSRNKDQKAFIGGSWSDIENDADYKTNNETCLMAQSSNEVTLNSSYYSDDTSSLDNDSMQIEYYSSCEICLKIINKNKILKTKRDRLEKKLELNEKIKKLEIKEIEIACKIM